MKPKPYSPRYRVPEPGVFAIPVPTRPINPTSLRRVTDLLWTFAEQLEHEADARNIAAHRIRRMVEADTAIPVPNPPRRRRRRSIFKANLLVKVRNPRAGK